MPCPAGQGACVRLWSETIAPFGTCSDFPRDQFAACVRREECTGLSPDHPWASCIRNGAWQGMDYPADTIFYEGMRCNELSEDERAPLLQACCQDCGVYYPNDPQTCTAMTAEMCARGYIRRIVYVSACSPPAPSISIPIAVREGCGAIPVGWQGIPHGIGSTCRCQLTGEPGIIPEWMARGVTHCLKRVNDSRTWDAICRSFSACCHGDSCSMTSQADCESSGGLFHDRKSCYWDDPCVPDDDFFCETTGLNVFVDEAGIAAFIDSPKKLYADRGECEMMRADPSPDAEGIARMVGCATYAGDVQKVGIGNPGHSECTAGYMEMDWDHGYVC